jgi:hypothetical protein
MDEEAPENGFVCDGFYIGGRFSGLLAKYRKPSKFSRVERDFLRDEGYADDAMLIDHVLYFKLLAWYEGSAFGRRMATC